MIGIALIVYGALTLYVALAKPEPVWRMRKIQGFVQLLSEKGTVILFVVVGVAALAAGLWLLGQGG